MNKEKKKGVAGKREEEGERERNGGKRERKENGEVFLFIFILK